MLQPKRKPGPPKKDGPLASNAGISLYPAEKEMLDVLARKLGKHSRGEVVRWFLSQHSYAVEPEATVAA